MFIDDSLLDLAGGDVGVADEQGDLVVLVQVGPQHLGEGVDVSGDGHALGLALEGGDHGIAVADIGVQEVAQTGGGRILPEETGAGVALGIGGLQDGHLVGAVICLDAGDSGGPVGAVVLELTGAQSSLPALAPGGKLPDGLKKILV